MAKQHKESLHMSSMICLHTPGTRSKTTTTSTQDDVGAFSASFLAHRTIGDAACVFEIGWFSG